jgi:DMSO/TMAO reductase YedYZ molybdopterin-dependent catalytic subunit/thiosulfate reductase cytochrome b subunit
MIASCPFGDIAVTAVDLGFPIWVRVSHWFNFLFVTMLVRSGLEILSAHPKLYWNNDCLPGSEWIRFTRKPMPKDRLWTSKDEEVSFPSWLALPGGEDKLGLGRYWHFTSVLGWTLVGLLYYVLLFATDQWRRLIPTSWTIVPDAWRDFTTYLSFQLPPEGTTANPLSPYNALQQLAYFAVVFWLTPHMILTGLAMSPAVESRARWYPRLFFGRQPARSLHFLGMVAYLAFLAVHLLMVVVHGPSRELTKMTLGAGHEDDAWLGLALGLAIIGIVIVIHVLATVASLHATRFVHRALSALVDPLRGALLHHLTPVVNYPESKISPYFRVNGYPPTEEYPHARDDDYIRLQRGGFTDWRLEVTGLVDTPLQLSLVDLRAMRRQEQTTMHHCIQGWTAIGRWAGVLVSDLLDRCKLSPEARYLVFHSYQRHAVSGKPYYEIIDLETARQLQTILAYEMNGLPLPIPHGAPLRLRVENELGFKMVKYLRAVEAVADYRKVGDGMGGIREDVQQFDMSAHI